MKAPDPRSNKLDLRCAHGLLRRIFLNQAMHLHVARDLSYDGHYLRDAGGNKRQTDELDNFDEDFSHCERFLDATYPWWSLRKDARTGVKVVTIYSGSASEIASASGKTSAEAACIALLRANAVEVLL